jgi:predicted metal-dependent TIM-barrel fold hydrolase
MEIECAFNIILLGVLSHEITLGAIAMGKEMNIPVYMKKPKRKSNKKIQHILDELVLQELLLDDTKVTPSEFSQVLDSFILQDLLHGMTD